MTAALRLATVFLQTGGHRRYRRWGIDVLLLLPPARAGAVTVLAPPDLDALAWCAAEAAATVAFLAPERPDA